MSIFSRLFKGPDEAGKESSEEESASGEQPAERPRKPAAEPPHADGKGAMRPTAPAFQIPAPAEREGSAGRAPVVQVSEAGPKKASVSSQSAQRAQPPNPPPAARAKAAGSAAVRAGTNAAPLPAPKSAAQRAATATQPRPSPPAAPAAQPPAPLRGRPAANSANLDALRAPGADTPLALAQEGAREPMLTLELGSPAPAAPPQPAPVAPTGTGRGMLVDSVDHLLNDLDSAFGAMVEPAPPSDGNSRPKSVPPSGASVPELRDLFASLAANHMRQVREFMIGVKWGEAPRDWVPICEPAVGSLMRAATDMDLPDLCGALEVYRTALTQAGEETGATIAGEMRDRLMIAYSRLAEIMPTAFGLEGERGRREAIIVHALLQQVPDVRKLTIDKIYAAGLMSLDHLFLARPDEISATTGIGENLAASIVEKFQRYRREIASLADATRATERRRLTELAAEMRELHREFERASADWSDDARAEKKKYRQARAEALLQATVLLARLGEIERLGRLERLPFERKIEELEQYLREAEAVQAPVA